MQGFLNKPQENRCSQVSQVTRISSQNTDKAQCLCAPDPQSIPLRKVSWSGMKKAPEHMAPSSRSLKNQKLERRETRRKHIFMGFWKGLPCLPHGQGSP